MYNKEPPSSTAVLSLVVGCLVMVISGTLYAWNSFEGGLERELEYSKAQLNVISSVANVCNLVAFPAGWVFDVYGPLRVVMVGSVLTVAGWLLLYFMAHGDIPGGYLWFMVFYSTVGHGAIWLYMAALLTSVRNFSGEHRGKVVGLLDAFFGASAAVFSAVYGLWFEGQPVASFFLFGAVCTTVCGGVLPLCFMRVKQPAEPADTAALRMGTDGAMSDDVTVSVNQQYPSLKAKVERVVDSEGTLRTYQQADDSTEGETAVVPSSSDIGGWKLLKHPDFLLMLPAFAITLGGGTAFLNVISQALRNNGKESLISTMTLVIPIMGTVVRFFSGLASDLLIDRIPRVFWVLFFVAMFCVSEVLFVLAWSSDAALYTAGALSGLAFGGMWCVSPTLLSEEFGVTHFGFNWGVALVACVVGTVVYGNVSSFISSSQFFLSLLAGNLLTVATLGLLSWRTVRRVKSL